MLQKYLQSDEYSVKSCPEDCKVGAPAVFPVPGCRAGVPPSAVVAAADPVVPASVSAPGAGGRGSHGAGDAAEGIGCPLSALLKERKREGEA